MIGPIADDPALAQLSIRSANAEEAGDTGSLGQEEFLRLMITQLKNQDPTKPLESGEFLGQLAQFGTVSGLATLQSSFDSLADSLVSNQALQAAGLVGRTVLARSDIASLEAGGSVSGAVDLPASSGDVRVQIVDAAGALVKEISLGSQPAGLARFSWAGDTDLGQPAPPGQYRIVGQYLGAGQNESAPTLVNSVVESVSLRGSGLGIQLRGLGEFQFDSIEHIG